MTLVKFEDHKKNKKLFDIWKKSFEELNEGTKKLFANHVRLYINRIILNDIQDYPGYEIKRLEVNDDLDQVIVYTHCPTCPEFHYTSISIIKYLSYFFQQQGNDYCPIVDDASCDLCLILIDNGGSRKKNM